MTSIGYGPSNKRLYFDGDDEKFELWEVKFKAHLRIQKLHSILDAEEDDDEMDDEMNELVFAEMVQYLDDKSLSLIVRDAKDDGFKAMKILREYYLGTSEPRIISLYCELTTLKMNTSESITDYMLRAERAATRLKAIGEVISDGLLIAMILKGLPESFKAFSIIVTQKSKSEMDFIQFKTSLRNYEENEKARLANCDDDKVLKLRSSKVVCYQCGKRGHFKSECTAEASVSNSDVNSSLSNSSGSRNKNKRWCVNCKSSSHDTNYCRKTKKNSTKSVSDQPDQTNSFFFRVTVDPNATVVKTDTTLCNLLVDCGATAHIICDRSKFISFDPNFDSSKHFIELADGTRKNNIVSARGNAQVELTDLNGVACKVILQNALCIPTYKQDILSVQSVTENGASVYFSKGSAKLQTHNGNVFNIKKTGKLYFVNTVKSVKSHTLHDWHNILGHCNVKDVLKLENVADGIKITSKDNFDCSVCAEGKMCEYRNYEADRRATEPLQLVHTDLAGPVATASREGAKYAITFVDDFSGLITVYFLKNKSDTAAATAKFLADMAPYGTVKRLRSDNGTEYTSNEFKNLMVTNKIKHEYSAPYSPHQNGTAERSWRSLFEMGRCLLLSGDLPKSLWSYAVRAASYIRNRCYSQRIMKTPYEMFTSIRPNISHMHTFGTTCFAYNQNKQKLDPRCDRGQFIGYDPQSPAYLVYIASKNEVRRVRCVKFHENDISAVADPLDDDDEWRVIDQKDKNPSPARPQDNIVDPVVPVPPSSDENAKIPKVNNNRRYPERQRNKPSYLSDYDTSDQPEFANCAIDFCYRLSDVPATYQEAISSPDCKKWQSAMVDEMSALNENSTFDLIPRPSNRSVVSGRWVFSVKTGRNN